MRRGQSCNYLTYSAKQKERLITSAFWVLTRRQLTMVNFSISLSEASNCDRYSRKSDNLCRFCNLKTHKIAGEFPLKMKGGILTQAQSYIFKWRCPYFRRYFLNLPNTSYHSGQKVMATSSILTWYAKVVWFCELPHRKLDNEMMSEDTSRCSFGRLQTTANADLQCVYS